MIFFKYVVPLSVVLAACSAPVSQAQSSNSALSSTNVYWSDADSGVIDGVKFRLNGDDAPETGGVGAFGGAKCESERVLGFEAKEYVRTVTRGKLVRVTREYGQDRYGRLIVDLEAEIGPHGTMVDLGDYGNQYQYLKPWPHKGSRALAPKPNWCKKK